MGAEGGSTSALSSFEDAHAHAHAHALYFAVLHAHI